MVGQTARREARGSRITAAVALLGVATAVMLGSLALREPFEIGAAGVFALAMAWTALRLAWNTVVTSRYEHAADRTELAQAYRNLFAERAVEQAQFLGSMTTRLAQRDEAIEVLESNVGAIRMRAVEAESSAATTRAWLSEAHDQLAAMEALITREAQERELEAAAAAEQAAKPPLRGAPRRTPAVAPEWAALDPDPVESLMAWEQHADQVAREHDDVSARGRHAAG